MAILVTLLICFALGVPIAFGLGMAGLVSIVMVGGIRLEIVPLMVFNGSQSYTLIAIPLFILMGQIMNRSSISTRLIDFASALVGFIRGGLGMATICTGTAMAAISGSSVADAAALGAILIPQMDQRGYGKGFAVSIVSSAATLAQVIPPSITMILYAVIARVSIRDLFIAGLIPGVLCALGLMAVVYVYARSNNLAQVSAFSLTRVSVTFKRAFLGLLLPFIVIGGILGGYFTPTEAGAIGVFYAMLLSTFIYKEMTLEGFVKGLNGAAKQTAIVIIMVGTSQLLSWYLTQQQIPERLAASLLDISTNRHVVALLVSSLILVAGMFLHGTPLVIMLIPMLAPLMSKVGMDLTQFGIVTCIAVSIGQITPPVASVLMVTSGIAELGIDKIVRPLMPFILVLTAVMLLTAYVPGLSLWLPGAVGL